MYRKKISSFWTHYPNLPIFHHSTSYVFGIASLLWPGPEDQVFDVRINPEKVDWLSFCMVDCNRSGVHDSWVLKEKPARMKAVADQDGNTRKLNPDTSYETTPKWHSFFFDQTGRFSDQRRRSYEIPPARNSEKIERPTSNVEYWWFRKKS